MLKKITNWVRRTFFPSRFQIPMRVSPGQQTQTLPWLTTVGSTSTFLPRPYREWHNQDLTGLYTGYRHDALIDILSEIDPDMSAGAHALITLTSGTGWTLNAKKNNGELNTVATSYLRTLANSLTHDLETDGYTEHTDGIGVLISRCLYSSYTRGAMAVEAVISPRLTVEGIVSVDPETIDFEQKGNELRVYQWQSTKANPIELNNNTFFYLPFQPSFLPFGRNPILSALPVIFFRIGVLRDLERVFRKVAYPRISVKVLQEILIRNAPPDIQANADELKKFVEGHLNEVNKVFQNLRPEEHLVFTDTIDAGYMETHNTNLTMPVETVIQILNGLLVSSLKTYSTVLGKTLGSAGEGKSGNEITLYLKSLKYFQDQVGMLLSKVFTLAMRLGGYQGNAEFRLNTIELRTPTELEQWRQIQIQNAIKELLLGFESWESVCQKITGHGPAPGATAPDSAILFMLIGASSDSLRTERPSTEEGDREEDREDTNRETKGGRRGVSTTDRNGLAVLARLLGQTQRKVYTNGHNKRPS